MMMCIFKSLALRTIQRTLKGYFSLEHLTIHVRSLRCMNVLVLPNPKQLHMVLTQLDMPQRDIETRFLILLGEPLVRMNLDI